MCGINFEENSKISIKFNLFEKFENFPKVGKNIFLKHLSLCFGKGGGKKSCLGFEVSGKFKIWMTKTTKTKNFKEYKEYSCPHSPDKNMLKMTVAADDKEI